MPTDHAPALLTLANAFADKLNANAFIEAITEFYADDCEHHEAYPMGDMPQVSKGKATLLAMNEQWEQMHEVHDFKLRGPYPHGNDRFALHMMVDLTPNAGPMANHRYQMDEVCIYHVAEGKIKKAEFFWDPTGYEA